MPSTSNAADEAMSLKNVQRLIENLAASESAPTEASTKRCRVNLKRLREDEINDVLEHGSIDSESNASSSATSQNSTGSARKRIAPKFGFR